MDNEVFDYKFMLFKVANYEIFKHIYTLTYYAYLLYKVSIHEC